MNKVFDIIKSVSVHGKKPVSITSLVFDSRKVNTGAAFFAISGTLTDGHNYIETAISQGAAAIICEKLPAKLNPKIYYIEVADSSIALAEAANIFYGNPSQELILVGVTGTNGKTTTATLLHDLFTVLGYKVGLLSTVVNKIGDNEIPATHTTPDPVELNSLLREMVESGCEYCFMEVSSHSIVQNRVKGLTFKGGIFTNLTHDHLDYHGTFSEYLTAKKRFFDSLPKNAFALTNLDDRNGEVMLQNCNATHRNYSLQTIADYQCKLKEIHLDGMLLELNGHEVWVHLIGRFNAYNIITIYGVAMELGATSEETLTAISTLHPIRGRFECVWSNNGRLAVVDYAHTPDALQNVLKTLSEIKTAGQIITVVGCGGDRDTTKRPIMAQIAANMSDLVILTSDNPRTEDPDEILRQMQSGLDPVLSRKSITISNRHEAIRTAAKMSKPGDIILIAGKGHETYQETNGVRHHFDDKEEILIAFSN